MRASPAVVPSLRDESGSADITAAHAKAELRPSNAVYGNIAALGKVFNLYSRESLSIIIHRSPKVRQISPLPNTLKLCAPAYASVHGNIAALPCFPQHSGGQKETT